MKSLVIAIAGISFLVGCSGSRKTERLDPVEKMALGWIHRGDFMASDYPKFKENYDTASVDQNFIEMIRSLHSGFDFVVVLGTWCSDSKRDVPRFLKIADLSAIPSSRIQFYGVDRSKKSADGVTEKYNIERVPTFIAYKEGIEVGRIVEFPENSVEEDLLVILAGAANK